MRGNLRRLLIWVLALSFVLVFLTAVIGCGTTTTTTVTTPGGSPAAEKAKSDLRSTMRTLWSFHAWYTREYYVAAVLGTPNADATAARLLKNQVETGDAFAKYYGKEAGDKVAALLTDHIKIATEVVAAAKAGDQAALTQANDRWHQNFVDLARFLSDANPNYPYDATLDALNQHLSLLTADVTSFIGKDYAQSVIGNDTYYEEILQIADFLTDGIIKQFPDKF